MTRMAPTRNGVGASCVALPAGPWPTIEAFLCERFPAIPAVTWHARLMGGEVFDEGGTALAPLTPYRPHSRLYYYRSLAYEAAIPFTEVVLYQDEFLVAVDKPHFLPVTPAGAYLQETLLVRLKRRLGVDTLTPMHRLDRDTAGVVLLCVQPAMRDRYQALFRDRCVAKRYEAIAPWRPDLAFPLTRCSRLGESPAFMQMQETSGTPNAETRIDVVQVEGALARYVLQPVTGQKHQLRVHMAALGMPILNDRIYPALQPAPAPDAVPDYSRPLQLLARALAFIDPIMGVHRSFESARLLAFPAPVQSHA